MINLDYHLHTNYSFDSNTTMDKYCKRALEIGFKEIAFTDHFILDQPEYQSISLETFRDYYQEVNENRKRYPINIKLGLEVDYLETYEEIIRQYISQFEENMKQKFDFIMGAVHFLDGRMFTKSKIAAEYFKDRDVGLIYTSYFTRLYNAVNSKLFDIIAHPDVIRIYTGKYIEDYEFERYEGRVSKIVTALIKNHTGLEVNAKGYDFSINDSCPSSKFLAKYIDGMYNKGQKPILTIGSDAHAAKDLGRNLDKVMDKIVNAGAKEYCSFTQRRHDFTKI